MANLMSIVNLVCKIGEYKNTTTFSVSLAKNEQVYKVEL